MLRLFTYLPFCLIILSLAIWQADADAAASKLTLLSVGEQAQDKAPADDEKPVEDKSPADEDKAEESATEKTEEPEEKSEEKSEEETEEKEEATAADEDAKEEEKTKEEDAEKAKKDEVAKEKKKAEEKAKEKENEKPHKVERKPLKIEAAVDAVFVASGMEEVALRPEKWLQFKVVEAVEHGAQVKKGDVLVRFDDEKIEKKLAEEMLDQQLGELAMMREEEEFPRVKRLLELKYEEARREHEELLEDYEYYKSTDRPFMVRITNYRYQQAQEDLASQREELEQLEKMYAADELTEETEAIVLRRQRFEVETAELILKLQTADRDLTLNVQLPRRDQSFATTLEEAELKLKQSQTAKETGLTRGRYELEKKRKARALSIDSHSKLVGDRALMELRAPADGTVYYGKCVNGKWAEVASYATKLKPFGTVAQGKIIMTIVQQRPLTVRATLTEKGLPDFKSGLEARIVPAGDSELELPGKVTEVSAIPGGDKKFVAMLEIDTVSAPEWLVAGMTCKANVTVYENESALVIPADMVQTDEDDKKIKYVMLVDSEEEEPKRQNVKLGRKKDKLVEVLKGLDEGDEIVKEKKEEDKKDKKSK